MTKISIDPAAELSAMGDIKERIERALSAPKRKRRLKVELESGAPPRHAVVQLLASCRASRMDADGGVTFGPHAAAILARMRCGGGDVEG